MQWILDRYIYIQSLYFLNINNLIINYKILTNKIITCNNNKKEYFLYNDKLFQINIYNTKYVFPYSFSLYINILGNKIIYDNQFLCLELGYSHIIIIKLPKILLLEIKKSEIQYFITANLYKSIIMNIINLHYKLSWPNYYTNTGLMKTKFVTTKLKKKIKK